MFAVNSRVLLCCVVFAVALPGCAKKSVYQMGDAAAQSDKMMEAKLVAAPAQRRPADSTLAYEHEVDIELDRDRIAGRVEEVRAACAAEVSSGCVVLEVSTNVQDAYLGSYIKMRIAPGSVEALVNKASEEARVKSRRTTAEDLAQPLADVGRQLSMLSGYRDRLTALLERRDTKVADLIATSKELAATQTQIEELTAQKTHLRRRIDTDLLTIHWRPPAAQLRAADSPIGDAFAAFGVNFREATAEVIRFVASLVPWLVIILPGLILLRLFWRWSGAWLARRMRVDVGK